jgi:hypothetical protein
MPTNHWKLAEAVRRAALDAAAETPAELRTAAASRAAGGPPMQEPYDALAREIGGSSYRVTDEQVTAVRTATGSDHAAFEIVAAAAVGAGLERWRRGKAALDEVDDAAI